MNIGFTGTQKGMTAHQKARLVTVLTALFPYGAGATDTEIASQFHHGDCIGSDYEAASIAKTMGFWIVAWPPLNTSKRGWFDSHDEQLAMPYLERDRALVDATERLIATPKEMEETLRSGTWATIRYARKKNKPIDIIWPQ